MGESTNLSAKSKKIFLTPQGVEELRFELTFLKKHKRVEIAQRLQNAREQAGTEESSEFDSAMVEQELMENRISELERILREAKIIKSSASDNESVILGSTVLVQIQDKLEEFTVVGKMEANPT